MLPVYAYECSMNAVPPPDCPLACSITSRLDTWTIPKICFHTRDLMFWARAIAGGGVASNKLTRLSHCRGVRSKSLS